MPIIPLCLAHVVLETTLSAPCFLSKHSITRTIYISSPGHQCWWFFSTLIPLSSCFKIAGGCMLKCLMVSNAYFLFPASPSFMSISLKKKSSSQVHWLSFCRFYSTVKSHPLDFIPDVVSQSRVYLVLVFVLFLFLHCPQWVVAAHHGDSLLHVLTCPYFLYSHQPLRSLYVPSQCQVS